MKQVRSALVIAAHPDDEVLGCGGTIARLSSLGLCVAVLLLGEGPTSREENNNLASREEAFTSAQKAAKVLGVPKVRFGSFPDNRFDTVPLLDIVKTIESVKQDVRPDIVFTHHSGDLNIDHVLTHRATMTAFRPLPGENCVTVLGFEVLSSTEYSPAGLAESFHPTVYVGIDDFLEVKQAALAVYASEVRPWPHPRSHEAVEHLARLRGSQCGVDAAEAFVLQRSVW